MAVQTLDLREIENKAKSLYEAVIIISRRARQINTEITEQIKAHLGNIEVDEESGEDIIDRISIISEFDKKAKPTTLAIEEIIKDKLEFEYIDKTED